MWRCLFGRAHASNAKMSNSGGSRVCVFLMSPARGHAAQQLLTDDRSRARALGKWRVPKPVVQSLVEAGLQASSCTSCAVHAVALVPYFEAIEHPGLLHTVWHRHLRHYMFVSRGRKLSELLWSRVGTLAEFTTPWRVSPDAFSIETYSAPQHDCFYAPWSRDSDSLLSLEVRCHGFTGTLRDLLQEWHQSGCGMYMPDRNHALRFVGVQLPSPFLFGLLRGTFDLICVGDAFQHKAVSIRKFLTNTEISRKDRADEELPEWSFSLRPSMFGHAAQLIRGSFYEADDDCNLGPTRLDVLHWLDTMSTFSAAGLARLHQAKSDGSMIRKNVYQVESMIQLLLMACHVRGDRRLATVVEQCGTLIGMEPGWLSSSSDPSAKLPSRARLCQMRFFLDVGFCILMQGYWEQLLASGEDFIICMLADSSPRVGKDWLLSEIFVITDAAIAEILEAQEALAEAFACELVDWEHVRELEVMSPPPQHKNKTRRSSTSL